MKRTLFYILLTLILVSTFFLPNTFAQYQDYMQLSLPEGAKARFGKGWISGDIAYSPDGTRLAVSSSIGIWIYDANTFAEVALLTGHTQPVNSVDFSPDGKMLVSGSKDGTVRLWDVQSGELINTFEEHTNEVSSVKFSPDGKMFASGSYDFTVRLRDTDTGEILHTLRMVSKNTFFIFGSAAVFSVAFSPDGKILATGDAYRGLLFWDVNTGKVLKDPNRGGGIRSVVFSSDGVTFASASDEGSVQLWGALTGNHWQNLSGHTGVASCVAFSPDGKILASGGSDKKIKLYDAFTGEHLRTLDGHQNKVLSISFSSNGQTLTSVSWTEVRVWNTDTGIQQHLIEGHTRTVYSATFSPSGNMLAIGHQAGTIILWDPHFGEHKHTFITDNYRYLSTDDGVYSVAFSPDGNTLVSGERIWGGGNGRFTMWNAHTKEHLYTFTQSGAIHSIAFSPDGSMIAHGAEDRENNSLILLRNALTGEPSDAISLGLKVLVYSVTFSPDSKTLVTGMGGRLYSNYSGIQLWHVPTERRLKTFLAGIIAYSVAYSPDGSILAGTVGDEIWLWNPRSGVLLHTLEEHVASVQSVAFSPDGSTLVSASWRVILFWDAHTGERRRTIVGHTGWINSVAFSPDGKTLASGSYDGTVLLWELDPTTPEPEKLTTDVNGDSVVNIQDLVLVASRLGQTGENDEDINGDGVVNIQDLVLVAAALGNSAAAPSMYSKASAMLSTPQVQKWLTQAQQLNLTGPRSLQGILFLEQLLAALTPKETALLPNYPNPFNPETWIPYQLAKSAEVSISIYTADGKLVRTLDLGHQAAGIYQNRSHAAYWDGTNDLGESVASGVYFYTFTAGDFSATRKMLILK